MPLKISFCIAAVFILSCPLQCQDTTPDFQLEPRVKSVVIKNDRTEYIGYILKRDSREILLESDELGELYIPLHEIKEIRELEAGQEYSSGELFASRYFITTNGLALKKGERYALFNWYGPEIHFNVAENVSMGAMTTWMAAPLIGSLKFSIPVAENFSLGAGMLVGSALWAGLDAAGALFYGSATIGNYANNLTLSGGWIGLTEGATGGSAPLMSVAFLIRASQNFSIVGDSFILLGKDTKGALIIPGLRYSRANTRAFQFGLAGVVADGQALPFPIPYIGFFRAF